MSIGAVEIGALAKTVPEQEPGALITALCHDLGKIPTLHDRIGANGDHAWLSSLILKDIPDLQALPDARGVSDAVCLHHQRVPCGNRISR